MKEKEKEKREDVTVEPINIFKEIDDVSNIIWQMRRTLDGLGWGECGPKKILNRCRSYKRKLNICEKKLKETLEEINWQYDYMNVTKEEQIIIGDILFYIYTIQKLFLRFRIEVNNHAIMLSKKGTV